MILQYVGNPNLCINYLQDGKTALSIAKKSEHNEIVELLQKAKVCWNSYINGVFQTVHKDRG